MQLHWKQGCCQLVLKSPYILAEEAGHIPLGEPVCDFINGLLKGENGLDYVLVDKDQLEFDRVCLHVQE